MKHEGISQVPVDELSVWFDEQPSEMSEPAPIPDSAEKVARHARRLYVAQRRKEFAMELYKAEQEKLAANMASILAPIEKAIEWNGAAVEAWHRAALASGEAGKTVEFPSGLKSKLTAPVSSIVVSDHDLVMAWLEDNDHSEAIGKVYPPVDLAKRFKVSELKKLLTVVNPKAGSEEGQELTVIDDNGAVVDGVRSVAKGNTWKGSV